MPIPFIPCCQTEMEAQQGDAMADYLAVKEIPTFLQTAFAPTNSSGWDWGDLRNINYFLQYNVDPKVPADVRKNYNGIAKFFRAYFYFEKVKRFGDVPWINKPLDVSDTSILYGPRDPRTLVMDSVLADINYACANITSTSDATRSLITKYVAYALKSRICLFEGTYRKYHTELSLAGIGKYLAYRSCLSCKGSDGCGSLLNLYNRRDN